MEQVTTARVLEMAHRRQNAFEAILHRGAIKITRTVCGDDDDKQGRPQIWIEEHDEENVVTDEEMLKLYPHTIWEVWTDEEYEAEHGKDEETAQAQVIEESAILSAMAKAGVEVPTDDEQETERIECLKNERERIIRSARERFEDNVAKGFLPLMEFIDPSDVLDRIRQWKRSMNAFAGTTFDVPDEPTDKEAMEAEEFMLENYDGIADAFRAQVCNGGEGAFWYSIATVVEERLDGKEE